MLLLQLSERECPFVSEALAFILNQGSYNAGTLDIPCLHYIVTAHDTSLAKFPSSKSMSINKPNLKPRNSLIPPLRYIYVI